MPQGGGHYGNNPNVQQQQNASQSNAGSLQRASLGANGQLPFYNVAMINSPSVNGPMKDYYQSNDRGPRGDPTQINQSIQHLPKINSQSP